MARSQRYLELLKEPVVQFLMIGSSFFVANALIAPAESDGLNRAITVTDEQALAWSARSPGPGDGLPRNAKFRA